MSETPKSIKLADIDASGRLRPVDPGHVALIAAAIEESGLLQPIVVRPAASGSGYVLIAGAHRLQAMRDLGWEQLVIGRQVVIDTTFGDDLESRIAEIDENLCRHNLNALDRALFIAARKKLCSQRRREHGGDRKSVKFKEEINSQSMGLDFTPRFTVEVSKKVGLGEETVRLALHIADNLDPQAIAQLRGTKIERNQQQLLDLCKEPPQNQFKIAVAIAEGEAKTVADARVKIGLDAPVVADPQARLLAVLMEAWPKASKVTRATFVAEFADELAAELKKRGRPRATPSASSPWSIARSRSSSSC